MRDALYDACRRLDVKTAGRAYRDTADVSPRFLAFRYDGPDAVPGLESVNAFFASQVASRKALCSEACALVTAATGASLTSSVGRCHPETALTSPTHAASSA